jgi:hypothetical protein
MLEKVLSRTASSCCPAATAFTMAAFRERFAFVSLSSAASEVEEPWYQRWTVWKSVRATGTLTLPIRIVSHGVV